MIWLCPFDQAKVSLLPASFEAIHPSEAFLILTLFSRGAKERAKSKITNLLMLCIKIRRPHLASEKDRIKKHLTRSIPVSTEVWIVNK
jgi:hypothetical protein